MIDDDTTFTPTTIILGLQSGSGMLLGFRFRFRVRVRDSVLSSVEAEDSGSVGNLYSAIVPVASVVLCKTKDDVESVPVTFYVRVQFYTCICFSCISFSNASFMHVV